MIFMFLFPLAVVTSIAIIIIVPDAITAMIFTVSSVCISQNDNENYLLLFITLPFCGKITLIDVHNKGLWIYAYLLFFLQKKVINC